MSSKILYIGELYTNTTAGRLNRDLIHFLDRKGIDIYCRNTSREKYFVDEKIDSLCNKQAEKFDAFIQNTRNPYDAVFDIDCGKHYFANESNDFFINDLLKINFPVKPYPISIGQLDYLGILNKTDYEKKYDQPKYIKELKDKNKYIFYTFISRENVGSLDAIFLAYHKTFTIYDNAVLLIYTDEEKNVLNDKLMQFNNILKQDSYIESMCINKKFTKEEMLAIHQHSDCFVGFSMNSNYSYDALDAIKFGKLAITNDFYYEKITNYILPIKVTNDLALGGCSKYQKVCSLNEISNRMKLAYLKKDLLVTLSGVDDVKLGDIIPCLENQSLSK